MEMAKKRVWVWIGCGVFIVGLVASVLTWLTSKPRGLIEWESTNRQLNDFSNDVKKYVIANKQIPGDTLPNAVDAIRRLDPNSSVSQGHCTMFEENRDAWGESFIYEISADKKTFILRSKGANRIDDRGKNDDIQITIDLSMLGAL
jgi:hypothetical protein